MTTPERLALLARCEKVRRRLPAAEHPLISRAEAGRRIHEATDLGERTGLIGEPLPPLFAGAAAGQREGRLGSGQVA